VRSVLLSHERLDAILAPRVPGGFPLRPLTDRWNGGLARAFDAIVATSAFAAAEFGRVGAADLHLVPLGVDLDTFRPLPGDPGPCRGEVRLTHLGRLSKEKRPGLAVAAAIELHRRGVPVRLDLVGDGPLAPVLRAAAARAGLRARFHGHVPDRGAVARLLAEADVALAACPVESFGLAALEALACGTPVVAADRGAAPELLVPGAGVAVPPVAERFADGVQEVLSWPRDQRRATARARAERYPWDATVAGMLEVLTESRGACRTGR
jgi:alpha-1,6-mannosyltransferase